MKRRLSLFHIGVAGMAIIFSSCQKDLDAAKQRDEVMGTPLPGQTTYCRIESLWEMNTSPSPRIILFLYDQYENPVAITEPDLNPITGRTYKTFKYDHWHRLREYRGEYGNGKFRFWHFYGFDQNGRIGVDTAYGSGTIGMNGPVDYFNRGISKIEYDNQGRIVKEVIDYDDGGHFELAYSYDANGNLIYPPTWPYPIVYDNAMNINRTNDIWMFLNRDYSVNNAFAAQGYNASRLPTVYNTSFLIGWLGQYLIGQSRWSYSCREAYW